MTSMKSVVCSECSVRSEIPDEAARYLCSNCGATMNVSKSGKTSVHRAEPTSSRVVKAVILVFGVILIAFLLGPCLADRF